MFLWAPSWLCPWPTSGSSTPPWSWAGPSTKVRRLPRSRLLAPAAFLLQVLQDFGELVVFLFALKARVSPEDPIKAASPYHHLMSAMIQRCGLYCLLFAAIAARWWLDSSKKAEAGSRYFGRGSGRSHGIDGTAMGEVPKTWPRSMGRD